MSRLNCAGYRWTQYRQPFSGWGRSHHRQRHGRSDPTTIVASADLVVAQVARARQFSRHPGQIGARYTLTVGDQHRRHCRHPGTVTLRRHKTCRAQLNRNAKRRSSATGKWELLAGLRSAAPAATTLGAGSAYPVVTVTVDVSASAARRASLTRPAIPGGGESNTSNKTTTPMPRTIVTRQYSAPTATGSEGIVDHQFQTGFRQHKIASSKSVQWVAVGRRIAGPAPKHRCSFTEWTPGLLCRGMHRTA
jgi:hypothetical protein